MASASSTPTPHDAAVAPNPAGSTPRTPSAPHSRLALVLNHLSAAAIASASSAPPSAQMGAATDLERPTTRRSLRVLVTGAFGFLGQALLPELRSICDEMGLDLHIATLDIRAPANQANVDAHTTADIRDVPAVTRACEGIDVVIHTASVVDWGTLPEEELRAVNVGGTRAMLDACLAAGVPAFIYTSTLDVIFSSRVPLIDADESVPYPPTPLNAYCATKAMAERIVLAADGSPTSTPGTNLRTVVLRPSGIYGERDPYMTTPLVRNVAAGRLPVRLGGPESLMHHAYVGNVANAHAHVAARMVRDTDTRERMGGKVYFIVDMKALSIFDLCAPILRRLDLPVPKVRLPDGLAFFLGTCVDVAAAVVRPVWKTRPVFTYSSVEMLVTPRSVVGERLYRDAGWKPKYSIEEAADRTAAWFKENPQVWH